MHSTTLPTTPGALLGYTSKGRPIHLMAGGSGDDQGGQDAGQASGTDGDANAGQAGTDQGTSGTGTGQQSGQASGQQGGDAQSVKDLPDWAQKQIRDLRKEAGDNRTAANAVKTASQQQLDQVAQLLGLKKGEELDPAKMAEQLNESRATARATAVELAVHRNSGKHGADPDALLDSRGFLTAVAGLDPAAADFTTKVDAAIKEAVKTNPKLKAALGAAVSGGDFSGGTGAGAAITDEQLSKMTPAEITKAYNAGKLKHLM